MIFGRAFAGEGFLTNLEWGHLISLVCVIEIVNDFQ